jgi:uncharacterized GH25 family protein
MKGSNRIFAVLAGALLAAPLTAHDTWLLARPSAVQPGAAVVLELTSGMAFPAPETAIKPDRVARAGMRLAGATADLKDRRSAGKFLQFKTMPSKPGIATLWVGLAPKSIELKPAEVKEYLDEIGAPESVLRAWREQNPQRWRELYTKHAKTFVRVGRPTGDRSWAQPVGLALEIIPEKDPTALRPGEDLPLRVLLQGKPIPFFSVALVGQREIHGMLKTTDEQGRVVFPVTKAGRWMLRATDVRRSSKSGADWESDFATLTFEVR